MKIFGTVNTFLLSEFLHYLHNMKIIGIGDIHGRSDWKQIISIEHDYDKVVFIGDYFDSFDILPHDQLSNFYKILEFKEQNPDKVVLLLGNHDYHYISNPPERYSGYNEMWESDFRIALNKGLREDLIQLCYLYKNYLFTHAGVTNKWATGIDVNNLEKEINDILIYEPWKLRFQGFDPYGDDITQSPMWVRPNSLKKDYIRNYIHVVGHTQQMKEIQIKKHAIFIDSLINKNYLVIENNVPKSKFYDNQ